MHKFLLRISTLLEYLMLLDIKFLQKQFLKQLWVQVLLTVKMCEKYEVTLLWHNLLNFCCFCLKFSMRTHYVLGNFFSSNLYNSLVFFVHEIEFSFQFSTFWNKQITKPSLLTLGVELKPHNNNICWKTIKKAFQWCIICCVW